MAQSGLDFVEVGQHYVFAKTVGETDVEIGRASCRERVSIDV